MKVNWNFAVDIMILTIILGITAGWTDAAEAIMRPPAEYDFCAKSAIQDATDDYLANPDPAKLEPLEIKTVLDAASVECEPEKIHVFYETNPGTCYFRVLLVPVGYPSSDELDFKMKKLIGAAVLAFNDIPGLSFAYVSPAYKIDFVHVERFVLPKDNELLQKLWESLTKSAKPNVPIFVLNTSEYVGTADFSNDPPWGIIAGETEFSNSLFQHELGHLLSLNDGYEAFYRPGRIPGTELFFENLPINVYEAYSAATAQPFIVRAGSCCTQAVYRFADSKNTVMTTLNLDSQEKDLNAFSEIQARIMGEFVKKYLLDKFCRLKFPSRLYLLPNQNPSD
ncbi:MAG: hypothetical protein A2746_00445 [Candidatus Yanofskybacteria bacterium RIFCSPHIGHO2_01_FULL_44_22]|uniref:Uncharacterized protein n=1 Tax=Candidatus Yanofskybacteria bacterium RIFCSPHIGHO2_01_FULL_44_22 TaxID=1802669 RepID=A0A1F8EYE4_9BACT|nr:MAG: hypothetical protein A2746_00445 [Candidatus Yanofskybacteria bacterium RIFCSPHIGHO2_01_FULL_44_22]